ncbi:signal peptidase I [Microbacteriaceae bacterium SG_E_30_P1]|uniref:Signal peptidase I n=1 Tax=Antiquaquibacter oligotrophicus TaxID=2880260 RepID=A0ABT6KQF5_9MICO|nr:signal peptidase I [Antiquaquibacter oligotrophicus]MDH6181427.1 signal peptidase I [Antiquaquibacter oligotrophicus]UDF12881.1 signal peptidase I [Antiquaquibacter oligotrophicus]
MTDNTINEAVAEDQPAPSRSKGWKLFIRDVFLIILAALLISFLIKTFLIRSFYIPSSSMEETLQIDDRIIVNQLSPELMPVTYGDVVVFRDPGGWLTPQPVQPQNWFVGAVDAVLSFVGLTAPDSNDHLIKRIIGMPGDTIVCCNDLGQISVNGVPLDEPYITLPDGADKATRDDFEVTVPEGHLWVMGDNRYNSADSSYHRNDPTGGFVPIENVVGRALVVSWPVNHWTWLDNYPLTFADVEAAREESSEEATTGTDQ